MTEDPRDARRPAPDPLLTQIADYVLNFDPTAGSEAMETARLCLMDSLGCAMLALQFPACTKLLGPVVPGAGMPGGARVPGTGYELDPVRAAFNTGAMIRWLDFNDTWLAVEWGHPSDNLGGILAVADYLSRQGRDIRVRDVLRRMVQAYEIQGVLALENSFNRVGLDHVLLVRVATAAVAAAMLGGGRDEIVNALSNAWIDGAALRTYRHAPNTGPRKSWAAGDATSRGVWLALHCLREETGYPSALSARHWGFQEVLFRGREITLARPMGSYVIENILFKVSYPAEFHAQTAVEAAVRLHPLLKDRLQSLERIEIETQEAGKRIIDKTGPLSNPADRDHCLQYMTAVALLKGGLTAEDYEDEAAADPRINELREKMRVVENGRFTHDYLDQEKRSIANAIRVQFQGGAVTERVEVEYPLGHHRRRAESVSGLRAKFQHAVAAQFATRTVESIVSLFDDPARLFPMPAHEFIDLWAA